MKNFNSTKITEKDFDNAQQNFAEVSISDEKKDEMLKSIYSFVDEVEYNSPVPSRPSPFLILFQKRSLVFALAAILILSGTAYASEKSLPGDLLYKVKTDVVEPINYSLRLTKESKEEYKEILVKKRATEAEMLIKSETKFAESKPESEIIVEATSSKQINVAKPPIIVNTKTEPKVAGILELEVGATMNVDEPNAGTKKENVEDENEPETHENNIVDITIDVEIEKDDITSPKIEAKIETKVEPTKAVKEVTDTVEKIPNILSL